jgi:plasmid stabilization system protein ParE
VTLRLVFRPEAEEEIAASAEWYELRRAELAAEFLRALDAAVASVTRSPLRFPELHPGMRRCLLRRFPYSLIYSVSSEEIVIISCTHWRQNPRRRKWRG